MQQFFHIILINMKVKQDLNVYVLLLLLVLLVVSLRLVDYS